MAFDPSILGKTNADINEQLMNAQQQLALAQALRGQSLQPLQPTGGQNAIISPLSALAQALNGYTANKKMGAATHDFAQAQAAQAHNQLGMMQAITDRLRAQAGGGGGNSNMAGQGQTDQSQPATLSSVPQASYPGSPAAPNAAPQPAAVPSSPQQGPNVSTPSTASPDFVAAGLAAEMYGYPGFSKYAYDQADNRTELTKTLLSQGVVPGSEQWNQALAANVKKTNYIAPPTVAQGTVALDPYTNKPLLQNPRMADGVTADFTNPLAPTASQMPGYAPANAAIVGAAKRAEADAGIRDVTLPDGRVVPMRAGDAAAAGAAQAGVGSAPTYTGHQLSAEDLGKLKVLADGGNNDAKMLLDAHARAYPQLGADPTIQSGRTEQQASLKTKWDKLTADNATAQTANSYLQNIVEQAAKAAVGPQSDKIQFLNGLLSAAGISDRATDATTANNLIDKYHAQLTARLGGRSDAADAILAAGNPNSHMTGQAIRDAASNLQGANEMVKAKAALLAPHANALDPVGYSQKEIAFDQNADPRLWQYKAISDPVQRAAFLKNVLKQDPHFIDKAEALHKLGAY